MSLMLDRVVGDKSGPNPKSAPRPKKYPPTQKVPLDPKSAPRPKKYPRPKMSPLRGTNLINTKLQIFQIITRIHNDRPKKCPSTQKLPPTLKSRYTL